jgi:hypothetical protein
MLRKRGIRIYPTTVPTIASRQRQTEFEIVKLDRRLILATRRAESYAGHIIVVDFKMTFDAFNQWLGFRVNLNLGDAKSSPRFAGSVLSNRDGFRHFDHRDAFAGVRAEEARISDVLGFVLQRQLPAGINQRIVNTTPGRVGDENFNWLGKSQT